jgi:DNA gyrase subunit A
MNLERPDLSLVSPVVQAYIETLEAELASARRANSRSRESDPVEPSELSEPSEPPTTFQVITATARGIVKCTPRHLYDRQRRGGMGVFDLDAPDEDPPALLTIADVTQNLIVVTSLGRAFPVALSQLAESPVRGRGELLRKWLPLLADEQVALLIPDMGAGYLTLVTRRGQVRRWRYNVFGRNLAPGTILCDIREGGAPADACWTSGEGDLFIATAKGNAIRFAEIQVPVRGCLGIRCDPDDPVVGVAGVREGSGVLLIGDDGRGTIRLMTGFAQNKAPGTGGKQAIKADRLVGIETLNGGDDVFIISRLGKIIRFRADEIPAKEGVVQGVACMALRSDETVAIVVARI